MMNKNTQLLHDAPVSAPNADRITSPNERVRDRQRIKTATLRSGERTREGPLDNTPSVIAARCRLAAHFAGENDFTTRRGGDRIAPQNLATLAFNLGHGLSQGYVRDRCCRR
jgi:hypothetical protein